MGLPASATRIFYLFKSFLSHFSSVKTEALIVIDKTEAQQEDNPKVRWNKNLFSPHQNAMREGVVLNFPNRELQNCSRTFQVLVCPNGTSGDFAVLRSNQIILYFPKVGVGTWAGTSLSLERKAQSKEVTPVQIHGDLFFVGEQLKASGVCKFRCIVVQRTGTSWSKGLTIHHQDLNESSKP